ncbi:MAG: tetratricopeptide repeat protein [Bacteroidales bacterium]
MQIWIKKNIGFLCLLLACIFVAPLWANSSTNELETAYKNGNKFYSQKQYAKAIEQYQSILHQGYTSDVIYYNLGNAYYRIGDYPKAILNYERSFRIHPAAPDLKHNLALAQTKITDRFEQVPEFFLWSWWKQFMNLYSTKIWAIFFLCSIAFFLSCLLVYFIGKSYNLKKTAFFTGFFSLICICVCLATTLSSYAQAHLKEGIVLAPQSEIKSSPETGGKTKFILHEGSKVRIEDYIEPYYKVRIKDGNIGWLLQDDLEII